jgi:hypothetical protein
MTLFAVDGALVGTPPPAGSTFLYEAGQALVVTNSSGAWAHNFNTPFPNGVVAVIPISASQSIAGGEISVTLVYSQTTVTGFVCDVFEGGALAPSLNTRITYLAIGY